MALALDDRKLLPPGVHEASLEDIESLFARFQRSDRRISLFKKLRDYLKSLRSAECASGIIVVGSFVMGCVDKKRVRKKYEIDLLPVQIGSEQEHVWIDFFRQVNIKWCLKFGWPTGTTKGIVRVML